MALRNGTDVMVSTVEIQPDDHGAYNVVSIVTTLEYSGCSSDFAEFLAYELRENGRTFPEPGPKA